MGVAIPEEFRREMAMAGDWQVLSEKPVREFEKREKEEYKDIKPDAMGIGVRKRKHNGQDEEEEEVEDTMVRKGWGSTARTYPNLTSHDDELDFLLGKSTETRQKVGLGTDTYMDSSKMILEDQPTHNEAESISGSTLETPSIKQETSDNTECLMSSMLNAGNGEGPPIKQENSSLEPRILFKKRKSKPIRNK